MPIGDNVRILPSPATDAAGLTGLVGCVDGVSVPSMSGVKPISPVEDDCAINVYFESLDADFWMDPRLAVVVGRNADFDQMLSGIKPSPETPLGNSASQSVDGAEDAPNQSFKPNPLRGSA
jgi:hypothetical protein